MYTQRTLSCVLSSNILPILFFIYANKFKNVPYSSETAFFIFRDFEKNAENITGILFLQRSFVNLACGEFIKKLLGIHFFL